MTLIGRVRYAPPSLEDHGLITKSGQVFSVAVTEREYTVGGARDGVIGFYDGSWAAASGLTNREPASKDFTLWLEPRPQRNLKWELEQLCAALKDAVGFVRPDGLYLPLARADYTALGESSVDAVLLPRGEVWRHPLLDFTDSYTSLRESTAATPIVSLRSTDKALSTLPISMMPRGSMFVGAYLNEPDLMSYAALGSTVDKEGAVAGGGLGLYKVLGKVVGYVGATSVSATDTTHDGLKLYALTWEVGGLIRLYMRSDEGFVLLGSATLLDAPILSGNQLSLGYIDGAASAPGIFLPGAPHIENGLPFLAPRVLTYPEVQEGLEAWWSELRAISTFTHDLDAPALNIQPVTAPRLVLGIPDALLITVTRLNGLSEEIKLSVTSDHVALRLGLPTLTADADPKSDTWSVPITAEMGTPYGDHTLTIKASTPSGLEQTLKVDVRVFEFAPRLPTGTTHFWPLYATTSQDIAQMPKNLGSAGSAGDLVLWGLTRYSLRWDGVYGDGSDIEGFGPSIATVDSCVTEMGAAHTVTFAFWNPRAYDPNSVLFSVSSQSNKNDFWQVFKDGDVLKLRTSNGTPQVIETSSGGISAQAGVMYLSVSANPGGLLQLQNPVTDESASVRVRPWAGAGRLTLFGTQLADGTIQGLSRGLALVGSAQQKVVS